LVVETFAKLHLNGTAACGSFHFRKAARAITSFYDSAFGDSGIRSTQFTILIGIAKTQPTSITALGKLLIIDRTTLTRTLRRLQEERLITVSARSKMRQRFLTLTRKGEHALVRSLPMWRKAQERFVAAIGPEYWNSFRSELERLACLAVDLGKSRDSGGSAKQARRIVA
jgi:DNA-binding MarR family transcriptional regulator